MGKAFVLLGTVVGTIVGLYSFFLEMTVFWVMCGLGGLLLGVILGPVACIAAPWYVLFAWRNPVPIIAIYGGGLLSWGLHSLGGWLMEKE